ncbi:acyl-CoA dehydrogenase family protein [Caulobacter sp. S45]|uniref:acyl-CoA dehydrogenase family protein n=1 Tax=Caulobacter sp. S45 TaxID=1641861 RepID=UPI00131E8D80|nr:acyl-CoA dehydrogenase family protein [Caulobacter sp. S45]
MGDRSYLFWPFFDDAHRALADDLRAYVEAIRPLAEQEHDVDATCRALVARLGADGWLGFCVPEAYGGRLPQLDVRSLCLTREALAQAGGLADFALAMQGLGSGAISLFGDEALKAAWLPRVARGEAIAAFALSEPEAGSDVAAMTTAARADGDDYVLDGTKTWISNGGIADFYVVFARTGAAGSKGVTAFLVEADRPGFKVEERIELIAPHPLATISFTSCRIPKANRIGEEGQGFKIAMATLDVFRPTVGAAALGFARRALDEALKRAKNRKLFGAPMSALQLVQGQIADMALTVDTSALLVFRAAWIKDVVGGRITREAAMAKLAATDGAQQVIDAAVQIMGGFGVVSGHPVERLYREIRALRIYEGASEVQKVIIAAQTLAAADV